MHIFEIGKINFKLPCSLVILVFDRIRLFKSMESNEILLSKDVPLISL